MVVVEKLKIIPIANYSNWPPHNFKALDKNFHGNLFKILAWAL